MPPSPPIGLPRLGPHPALHPPIPTMRFLSTALGLALAAVATARPTARRFVPGQTFQGASVPATLKSAEGSLGEVEGNYMIKLKPGVTSGSFLAHQHLISAAQAEASDYYGFNAASKKEHGIRHLYDLEGHLQGYAGQFTDDVLSFIRAQDEVEYVERDSIVKTQVIPQAFAAEDHKHLKEKAAPWGLARISHRDSLGFGSSNYVYDEAAGTGVTAYIIEYVSSHHVASSADSAP